MKCVICESNDTFNNQMCGHSPLCVSCAITFDKQNYETSLRCSVCRGPALTWPGISTDSSLERARSVVFGDIDVDQSKFAAAIEMIECNEARVLATFYRNIPMSEKDLSVFIHSLKRSFNDGRIPSERTHAAVQLAVLREEDDLVIRALQMPMRTDILSMFLGNVDDASSVSPAVKNTLAMGARTWTGIDQAFAVRALVKFRVSCSVDILDALIPNLDDNTALLCATMALLRTLPHSDVAITRIAEIILMVPKGSACDVESDVHKRLVRMGAKPMIDNDTIIALTGIMELFSSDGGDTSDYADERFLPFGEFYAVLVKMGGIPMFNRDGHNVMWRGIKRRDI